MQDDRRLRLVEGDITTLALDAIVNAANSALAPGAGVDGAIRRAAGPEINAATAAIGGCPTGEARITPGFHLPARWVVHTVGPVWHGGADREDDLLARCYRNTLALASENGATSIAFPAISTGIYGFPRERAARIAITECLGFLAGEPKWDAICLVSFGAEDLTVIKGARTEVTATP